MGIGYSVYPDKRGLALFGSNTGYIFENDSWLVTSRLMTSTLVAKALQQAFITRRVEEGLIFHSDRGSQSASKEVARILKGLKCLQSLSGKGNCYDNAVVESFFHTLKTELIQFKNF